MGEYKEVDLSSRVTGVEAGSKRLHEDFNRLSVKFDTLSHEMTEGFSAITRSMGKRGETNWGNVIAGVSLILVVAMGWSSGFIRDLDRVGKDVISLRDDFVLHANSSGHTGLMLQTAANKESIKELDATLQREMRLLDAAGSEKLNGMTQRIEGEFQLNDKYIKSELAAIKQRLDNIRK